MLYTTLNLLRANKAYPGRFPELANYGPDEPIPLTRILEICGLDAALRTLSATTTPDKAARFAASLACDYADHLLPAYERVNPDDDCLRYALETTRRFLRGDATQDDIMELLDGVDRAAYGADIDAECDDEGGQFCWASDAADIIASVVAIAAKSADYLTNLPYLVEDLPESEREWQARHLAELLEQQED